MRLPRLVGLTLAAAVSAALWWLVIEFGARVADVLAAWTGDRP
jgi:hypothetical protein